MLQQFDESASKQMEEILEGFLESGEINKAGTIAGILEDPESMDPYRWFLLARYFATCGEMEQARDHMKRSIALGGHGVGAFLTMSRVLFILGEYDQAIFWAEKAIEEDPGLLDCYLHLARVHACKGDIDKAVDTVGNVLESEDFPDGAKNEAHAKIGRALTAANRHEEALPHLRLALSADGNDDNLWADLGNCQFVLGYPEEALESFRNALDIDPSPRNLYNLGHCLLTLDETEEAVKALKGALRFSPGDAMSACALGLAYFCQDMFEESAAASRLVLDRDPRMRLQMSNPGLMAMTNLGLCHMRMGSYEEALACFDKNINLIGHDYFNKGLALFRMQRHEDATACFLKALDISPNNAEAMNLLGQSYEAAGNRKEALSCLRRAIKAAPDYAIGYYDLAVILAKDKEKHGEAMECFEKYLSMEQDNVPGSSWALYSIACIHAVAGRDNDALDFFERALEKGLREREHIDNDRELDRLRRDPRFTEIMRKYF